MLASLLERLRERKKKSEKRFLVDFIFFCFLKLGPAQGTTPRPEIGGGGVEDSNAPSTYGHSQNGTRNAETPIERGGQYQSVFNVFRLWRRYWSNSMTLADWNLVWVGLVRHNRGLGVPGQFIFGDGPVLDPEVLGFLIRGHD